MSCCALVAVEHGGEVARPSSVVVDHPERLDRAERAFEPDQRDGVGRQEEVGAIDVDDCPQERVQFAVTFGHQVPVRRIRSLPLLGQRPRLRHLPVRNEPDEPGILPAPWTSPRTPGASVWLVGLATIIWTVVVDQGTKLWAGASAGGVEILHNPRYALGVIGGSVPVLIVGTDRRPRRLRRRDRAARVPLRPARVDPGRSCSAARCRT